MITCVECGKEMKEQYQEQDWCEECHTALHEECKKEHIHKENCFNCDSYKDCYNN